MLTPVVIATHPDSPWLAECVDSWKGVPLLILNKPDWELEKIRWMANYTVIPECIFMQDSCIIKKPYELYDLFVETKGSVALSNCPVPFGMYMGKYALGIAEVILKDTPTVLDKEHSIALEVEFANRYVAECVKDNEPVATLFPDFHDRNHRGIVHKNGRDNLILENDYLTKYKGTWR